MEAEIGGMLHHKPRNPQDCQQPPETRRGHGADSPSESPGGNNPTHTLSSDFQPPKPWENTILLFVVLCYSSYLVYTAEDQGTILCTHWNTLDLGLLAERRTDYRTESKRNQKILITLCHPAITAHFYFLHRRPENSFLGNVTALRIYWSWYLGSLQA